MTSLQNNVTTIQRVALIDSRFVYGTVLCKNGIVGEYLCNSFRQVR